MGEARVIFSQERAGELAASLVGMTAPLEVQVEASGSFKVRALAKKKIRTSDQNALIHVWFGQIAKHYGDRTLKDVKGACHHEYALDIRMKDKAFAWVWHQTGAKLDYEKQCKLLASETLGVSSKMTVSELRFYIDQMQRDYAAQGIILETKEDLI